MHGKIRFLLAAILLATAVRAHAADPVDSGADGESKKKIEVDQVHMETDDEVFGPGFHNESELGFVQTQGNSDAQSTTLRQKNSLRWGRASSIRGAYQFLRSESAGVESARRWSLGALYENDISDWIGWYAHQSLESNIYGGFRDRSNSELGGRYLLRKSQGTYAFAFLGARYSTEKRVDAPTDNSYFIHLYAEINHKFANGITAQLWADYLPNCSHHSEYFVNYEGSVSVMMTKILSLKSSYLSNYSNKPPPKATHQRDTTLTTALVARF